MRGQEPEDPGPLPQNCLPQSKTSSMGSMPRLAHILRHACGFAPAETRGRHEADSRLSWTGTFRTHIYDGEPDEF